MHVNKVIFKDGVDTYVGGKFDTLIIEPGTYQQFRKNTQGQSLEIDHLVARGSCDRPIYLEGEDNFRYLASRYDQELDNVILYNCRVRVNDDYPGQWTATNSFAFGDHNNIEILSSPPARTLYKVAGNNDWYAPESWSLSSGGPGGECTPRPTDRVIIDQNSFGSEAEVFTDLRDSILSIPFFCRDLIYAAETPASSFSHADLRVFGDWQLHPELDYAVEETTFYGPGQHFLDSRRSPIIGDLTLFSEGHYYLRDSLPGRYGTRLDLRRGNFDARGHHLRLGGLFIDFRWRMEDTLRLAGSRLDLLGGTYLFGQQVDEHLLRVSGPGNFSGPYGKIFLEGAQLVGHADSATIELPNGNLQCSISVPDPSHHAVIVQTEYRSALTPRLKHIDLAGNSHLLGNFITDTLSLLPGTMHTLQPQRVISTIRRFEAKGTHCRPIQFRISMDDFNRPPKLSFSDSALVLADYLFFDRVAAEEPLPAYIGPNSRVIVPWENNDTLDWTFAYHPGVDPFSLSPGFLGPDTIFCAVGKSLSTDSLLAPPVLDYQYRWEDGSSAPAYTIADSGAVRLALTFLDVTGQSCTMEDTVGVRIRAFEPQDWFPAYEIFPPRCAGSNDGQVIVYSSDSLGDINLNSRLPTNTDLWFDSLSAGIYTLEVVGPYGCPLSDSLELIAPEPISSDLPIFLERRFPEPARHPLMVTGGTPPYQYQWRVSDSLATSLVQIISCQDCPIPEFTPDFPTRFFLEISDANDCRTEQSVLVATEFNRNIYLPNAFSPDFNGRNDLLKVYGIEAGYQILDFRVTDRWGNEWFYAPELGANDGWDGLSPDERPAPSGVYLVTARLVWRDGFERPLGGAVHLLR